MTQRLAIPDVALPDVALPDVALPFTVTGDPLSLASPTETIWAPFFNDDPVIDASDYVSGGTPGYTYEIISQTKL